MLWFPFPPFWSFSTQDQHFNTETYITWHSGYYSSLSPFLESLPRSKIFLWFVNLPSFIIKSIPQHTPTLYTCTLPVLLLTEKFEHMVIKAMMNFVCMEVTCVSYRLYYLFFLSISLLNCCNMFHNISVESIILRFTGSKSHTLLHILYY